MNTVLAFAIATVASIAMEWAGLTTLKNYEAIVRIFNGNKTVHVTYNPVRLPRLGFAAAIGLVAGIAEAMQIWDRPAVFLAMLVLAFGMWTWTYYDLTTSRGSR